MITMRTFVALFAAVLCMQACASQNTPHAALRDGAAIPHIVPLGPAAFPQTIIYSANYDTNSVTEYGAFANGDVRPLRTIAGPHTKMDNPTSIAVDANGDIFVDDFSYRTPHISVYAPTADGDAAPIRTITAKTAGGIHSFAICLDAHGYLYESDTYARDVRVFAPGANGDATPVRTIFDPSLASPWGCFVDAGGHLWLADAFLGAILEFPPDANGTVHAGRRISGAATRMETPTGITLGPGRLIYVSDVSVHEVFVFDDDAQGDAAPIQAFAPPAPTTPEYSIAFHNGAIYVSLQVGSADAYGIAAFPPGSNGTSTPLREIAGPDTMLKESAIAVH